MCKMNCEGSSAPEKSGTDQFQAAVQLPGVPVHLLGEEKTVHQVETSVRE